MKKKKNNMISYIKKNKKTIIDSFYKANQNEDELELDDLNYINNKLVLYFVGLASVTVIFSITGVNAWFIPAIGAIVTGGTLAVQSARELAILVKNRIQAIKSYNEIKNISEPIEEEYQKEVKPVLSSYLVTNTNGKVRMINMITNDQNYPGIINFVLSDGTAIATYEDYFINTALYIDEKIFVTQYDGYEADIKSLHNLIKMYITTKPTFKRNLPEGQIDERESMMLRTLGQIYATVSKKVKEYENLNDGPKLRLHQ